MAPLQNRNRSNDRAEGLIVTPKAPLSVTLVTISAPTEAPTAYVQSPFQSNCHFNSHIRAEIDQDKRREALVADFAQEARRIDPPGSCATLPSRGELP